MKKWKALIMALGLTVGLGSAILATPASAVTVFDQCKNNPDTAVCKSQNDNATSMIKVVINILLYIIGIIGVIMIIIGGIRYSLSGGNASQLKEAKDTIIYSVVGLIVAIMSYAIVNFVVGQF